MCRRAACLGLQLPGAMSSLDHVQFVKFPFPHLARANLHYLIIPAGGGTEGTIVRFGGYRSRTVEDPLQTTRSHVVGGVVCRNAPLLLRVLRKICANQNAPSLLEWTTPQ